MVFIAVFGRSLIHVYTACRIKAAPQATILVGNYILDPMGETWYIPRLVIWGGPCVENFILVTHTKTQTTNDKYDSNCNYKHYII